MGGQLGPPCWDSRLLESGDEKVMMEKRQSKGLCLKEADGVVWEAKQTQDTVSGTRIWWPLWSPVTDVAGLLHRQANPSGSISMTATQKAVVSTPCCLGGIWPLHCQLGKVESERFLADVSGSAQPSYG